MPSLSWIRCLQRELSVELSMLAKHLHDVRCPPQKKWFVSFEWFFGLKSAGIYRDL